MHDRNNTATTQHLKQHSCNNTLQLGVAAAHAPAIRTVRGQSLLPKCLMHGLMPLVQTSACVQHQRVNHLPAHMQLHDWNTTLRSSTCTQHNAARVHAPRAPRCFVLALPPLAQLACCLRCNSYGGGCTCAHNGRKTSSLHRPQDELAASSSLVETLTFTSRKSHRNSHTNRKTARCERHPCILT